MLLKWGPDFGAPFPYFKAPFFPSAADDMLSAIRNYEC
jgi:hypothetical protein